ncbi:CMP167R [Camelpox virus CMS]|uniref:CMP167R n=3 Tax=Camelpox virus TaxID=28873 RepID=Q8QQ20_CAMPS|nr:CMP167R [Camelpox virus CMS]AKU40540.1 hypothetical protein TT95_00182 [Camelpox virus]WIG62378.1 hypothetical protein DIBLKBHL_00179 [Camelpox virus]
MDEAYYSGNLESVLGYVSDMHTELASISQLVISKIETINNDILNNDIVNFIMCRSNLNNIYLFPRYCIYYYRSRDLSERVD